jgi:[ribosomal protein S5]-alanine N-acetyltransferase
MQNNISTDRLLLNLLTEDDYEFIIELVNSKGWLEFIGDRNVHSKEEAVAYINKILTAQNLYYWVVRIKDENVPIGIISFIKRAYLEHFDIGFAFLPRFCGRGYAYEAAKEILAVVTANRAYDTILATTKPDNVSSIKLLIKLGFHFYKELDTENGKLNIYST